MRPESVPLREEAPGVLRWSRWNAQRQLDFNGTIVVDPDGNVAVDPPEMDDEQVARLRSLGGLAHVVITNRHHARGSEELRQRFAARVLAHRADAEGLPLGVDGTFEDGASLPAGLRAITVPHSKSPGETALLLARDGGTLIVGDAVIGTAGGLAMLPDDKFADPALARRGLAVLLAFPWSRLLLGDGHAPPDARAALALLAGVG